MAARTRKIRHDAETRLKIQTSQIVNRLTAHVLGTVDMPASAVTAALGLLRKAIPDLTSVSHSGEITARRASELSDDDLATVVAAARSATSRGDDQEHPTTH